MPNQIVNKAENKRVNWREKMRPRIGSTCYHNGYPYINLTGMNSEPGVGVDWMELPSKPAVAKKEVIVQEKSQLTGALESDVVYVLDGFFSLDEGEFINVPSGNLAVSGFGFDVSGVTKSVAGESIFKSVTGGSANLILKDTTYISGDGSVFDLTDIDGTHAIEFNDINFAGCNSLGTLNNYRQFTGTTCGFYGCSDGFILDGVWNGFKLVNTNSFGFSAEGCLFKKGPDLEFNNRFYISLNIDFPTGAELCDFDETNFNDDNLLQINATTAKVNGVISDSNAETLVPNITANNPRSLWSNNVGLPDTADEKMVNDDDVSGAYEIDWFKDTYILTMTGDTVFSEKNLPANLKNTAELKIYLSSDDSEPTFLPDWELNKVGTFKKGEINEITLKFLKSGVYFMKIDNSLTVYPAPDLKTIEPVYLQPDSTGQLTVNGSFFTPASIFKIEGSVVNSVEFVNSGQVILGVTAGSTEGDFDVIISNGTEKIFEDKFIVSLGEVTVPQPSDFTLTSGDLDLLNGAIKVNEVGGKGIVEWDNAIADQEDFQIRWKHALSPFDSNPYSDSVHNIVLARQDTGEEIIRGRVQFGGANRVNTIDVPNNASMGIIQAGLVTDSSPNNGYIFERENGIFKFKNHLGATIGTSTVDYNGPMKVIFDLDSTNVGVYGPFDFVQIKHIKV